MVPSMAKQQTIDIPAGYVAGTWKLDPVHSEVGFTVRHMMVSKVRGRFRGVTGTIRLADDPAASSVEAEVDMTTIDTGNTDRDGHIRSADFFEVDRYPTMTFRSTSVEPAGNELVVHGDLTLRGVTRPVNLDLEVHGFTKDPFGGTRCGFTATTVLNRKDFGISIEMPMDGGGVVVGDKINVTLEIEAVLDEG
jgi:polyisoprenoid-binding protein YceI